MQGVPGRPIKGAAKNFALKGVPLPDRKFEKS
jgi:hypothetical protein